jgi:tetratricopeptide (TPR) repeat protein
MLQLDRQFKEAAGAYAAAYASNAAAPAVAEQASERQAVALQLAGDYAAADKVCRNFQERYPASALRPEVMLRYAEDALLAAHAAKDPGAANADGSARPYGEAIVRFNRVIEKYPESYQANLARMGVATIHYLQGQYAEAAGLLNKIPESDRVDDLVGVGFLLADCELRTLPDAAEDALSGARVAAQLEKITTQLEAFVATRGGEPAAAEALMRIGYASNKLAALLADPTEKRRTQGKARRAYAQVVQQFPDHPIYAAALVENAKIMTQTGGPAPAIMALSKFQVAPLDASPVAPLALLHLADAQRLRRHPDEAIGLLTALRAQHEAELLKDPRRAEWVPAMQFSLALAYKEAGKYEPARELFAKIAKDFPKRPEANEVAWRIAQCQTDPAMIEVEGKRRALSVATKPGTQDELLASLLESTKGLRAAAEQMTARAAEVAAKTDAEESDLPARMYNDAAWCWKIVGEVEVDAARRALQAEAVRKIAERVAADEPKRSPAAILAGVRAPEVALSAIPPQPGEKLARETFKKVIEAGGDATVVTEARLELADLYAGRGETAAAIEVLKESIAADANPDFAERLKIRLATLHLSSGDAKAAGAIANEILSAQRNYYTGYARVIAAEAAYQQKDWAATIEAARPFLEAPRGIGRMAGVSDLGLLRMADAQGQLGQWKEAKETLDAWFVRFPAGYYATEARYAYGWVNEHLKDLDTAITAYEAAARAPGELGAKANLQVGRLRLAQDKPAEALNPLLTVAYAYDDPDLNPAALCEAARALVKLNKPEEARRLLNRAVKDYPTSTWAAAARKQLGEIK